MPLIGPPLTRHVELSRLLEAGVTRHPEDLALVSAITRWTWAELETTAEQLAGRLLGLGLQPGDRVASLMPNRSALVLHYLACFKAGLVVVPLNYRYAVPEMDHALGISGASLILAHEERGDDLAASRACADLPLGVIRYRDPSDGKTATGGALDFYDLIHPSASRPTASLPDLPPAAPAAIFFTSGSTGRPKGVTHSRASLGAMFAIAGLAFEMTSDDVLMPGSSMSHLGGFHFSLAALSLGARVVIPRRYDAEELLPLMRSQRPTILCMLPTALLHLVRDSHATGGDFASLRVCRSGADKVPLELEKEFMALTGFAIDEGYGMTEVGLSCLNPPSGTIKIGSVGTVNAGFALSIRDEEGCELPAGEEGRLWMRGPSVMSGYWDAPQLTTEVMRDGWLDSGDVMRADADGYLWFRGRKKQIIVHDGSNICPQEVEESLLAHPAVDNAGVVGVHDLVHGENVRAYVSFKAGATPPGAQDLIAFSKNLIGYKAPEEIQVLDEIPLNATGKVDRVTLKNMAAERLGPETA